MFLQIRICKNLDPYSRFKTIKNILEFAFSVTLKIYGKKHSVYIIFLLDSLKETMDLFRSTSFRLNNVLCSVFV